ncbi:MAG: FecR domain-containing protein [Candidatus Gracilibacteria bacterium]|nr:FecR domain-containing protein [Candidatus Gracilibacteria bacterium]MDQ7023584.1 FecR domain-containing protein [Candidatus Gracilibacteria bacterium]
MTLDEKDNLVSRINLSLKSGILWTKATKLYSKSEFEVYTSDTTAAVRGTIFAVKYRRGKTSLTTKEGQIKMKNTTEDKNINSGEFIGDEIPFTEFQIADIIIDYNNNIIIKNKKIH